MVSGARVFDDWRILRLQNGHLGRWMRVFRNFIALPPISRWQRTWLNTQDSWCYGDAGLRTPRIVPKECNPYETWILAEEIHWNCKKTAECFCRGARSDNENANLQCWWKIHSIIAVAHAIFQGLKGLGYGLVHYWTTRFRKIHLKVKSGRESVSIFSTKFR